MEKRIEHDAYMCLKCFTMPKLYKKLRDEKQATFLRYASLGIDYLAILPTEDQKLYGFWISSKVKSELSRVSGMPYEQYQERMQAIFSEFYGFAYLMMQRTTNNPLKAICNYYKICDTQYTAKELSERYSQTEHFFEIARHMLELSGDMPLNAQLVTVSVV